MDARGHVGADDVRRALSPSLTGRRRRVPLGSIAHAALVPITVRRVVTVPADP
jgi:hypothetical protein